MKLKLNDSLTISSVDMGEYLEKALYKLIQSEIEDFKDDREKTFQSFKSELIENLHHTLLEIKSTIDKTFFITNSTFKWLYEKFQQIMQNFEHKICSYLKELDNNNITIFYSMKKILNENGIYSLNFDGFIKIFSTIIQLI